MRLFSEATLRKMETVCTRNRKDWEASPSFVLTWFYPTLLLKPNEAYTRRSYLRASIVHAVAVTLLICLTFAVMLGMMLLIWPQLWSVMVDPRNRAQQLSIASQERLYLLPVVPFIWLLASFAFSWSTYFFWNRRAKRLQREGLVLVPTVAAAVISEDKTIWPPAPRP